MKFTLALFLMVESIHRKFTNIAFTRKRFTTTDLNGNNPDKTIRKGNKNAPTYLFFSTRSDYL